MNSITDGSVQFRKTETKNQFKTERDSQTQKTNSWLPKEKGWGGINQEFEINTFMLLDKQQGQQGPTVWFTGSQSIRQD